MQTKESVFLSTQEALDAVNIAISHYSFQFDLISSLWPLVFDSDAYVVRDADRRHFWAKTSRRSKLFPADEEKLNQLMLERLKHSPPSINRLSKICCRVFGAASHGGAGPSTSENGPAGIWITTDMGDFRCIRCGHCCRTLNYHDGCSLEDYHRWLKLGRDDILAWVGTIRKNGEPIGCRIWMKPGTNQFATICPWLKQVDQSGRSLCTIHDVRPTVCRQYPGTRKHARLTGCRGI